MAGRWSVFSRLRLLGELPVGTRFRFQEEPRSQGYPYTILATPATYRGEEHFAPGETPVVIRRRDGRYPRYGKIEGYFPVQDSTGKIVRWVAHPATEVRIRNPWGTWLALGGLTLLVLIVALIALYFLMTPLAGQGA